MNSNLARRIVLALTVTILLSLGAQAAHAAESFQLHVETRLASPPSLHHRKSAPATQPHETPRWSSDFSVSLDQPFSSTFVDGRTTTSIKGTVHDIGDHQFKIALSVERVTINQPRPGETVPTMDNESFSGTRITALSEENALAGFSHPGAATGPTTFLTLSPARANP